MYVNVQTGIYFLLLLGKCFRLKISNICLNIINSQGGIDLTKNLKKGGGGGGGGGKVGGGGGGGGGGVEKLLEGREILKKGNSLGKRGCC